MIIRHKSALLISWLWLLLSLGIALAAEPESAITYFDNLPARLYFLDDTKVCEFSVFKWEKDSYCFQTVVYHDVVKGDCWVSLDEGKSWKLAEGIPTGETAMVFEHPFNNRYVSCFNSKFGSF